MPREKARVLVEDHIKFLCHQHALSTKMDNDYSWIDEMEFNWDDWSEIEGRMAEQFEKRVAVLLDDKSNLNSDNY